MLLVPFWLLLELQFSSSFWAFSYLFMCGKISGDWETVFGQHSLRLKDPTIMYYMLGLLHSNTECFAFSHVLHYFLKCHDQFFRLSDTRINFIQSTGILPKGKKLQLTSLMFWRSFCTWQVIYFFNPDNFQSWLVTSKFYFADQIC